MAERRGFRPRFWPTVAALPMLLVLLGLGTWQLDRLVWKRALIAEMQARTAAPAVALPDPLTDAVELRYRPIEVSGRFLHDRELYVGARSYRRQAGYHVVTPLLLDDGRSLLVNRGWVPSEAKDPRTRRDGQVEGQVTLRGLGRLGGWQGNPWFRPDNDQAANLWLWLDLAAMVAAAGLERPVTGLYIDAAAAQHPGRYPIGGQTRVALRNDHLQYALTWYALAVVLVIIYLLFHRRAPRERPGGSHPSAPSDGPRTAA